MTASNLGGLKPLAPSRAAIWEPALAAVDATYRKAPSVSRR